MKSYRTGFAVTLAINVLLAAALAYLWWRSNAVKTRGETAPQSASAPSSKAGGEELPPAVSCLGRDAARAGSAHAPALAEHRGEDRPGRSQARRGRG